MQNIAISKEKVTSSYKFLKEIGRGASGVCYRVSSKANPADVRCIKKIKKAGDIPNEAKLMEQLTHPNILKLYEIFQDESSFFFVSDLCEGGELFDFLAEKETLSEHEAKEIFIQIISAVSYCHEKKISHRDLKPENFLLTQRQNGSGVPEIKLIDFDLSFQWEENMGEEVRKIQGKRIIGTPYYIAPEIIEGNYDKRCDIWSAGVMLYILLTGVPPFNGDNPKQILKAVKSQNYTLDIPEMKEVGLLAKDLIKRLLQPAEKRITIEQIFKHPWMKVPPKKLKLKIDFGPMVRFSKFSKLREIVALYIASNQTSRETSDLTKIFRALDVNMDGYLSVDELKAALGSEEKKNKEIENLIHFVETDKNGMMNYNEFIASFVKEQAIESKNNLMKVFNMIDRDGNGSVDNSELEQILKKLGFDRKPLQEKRVNEEVNKIFKVADKNNDGKIDFEQFVETICKKLDL